jgi:hypothetical protein
VVPKHERGFKINHNIIVVVALGEDTTISFLEDGFSFLFQQIIVHAIKAYPIISTDFDIFRVTYVW